jgi:short subunit fatty acids transporter
MSYTVKRETIEIVVVVIVFLIVVPIMFLALPKKGDVVRIDCTWSEISPDFTNEMREACRQLRATNNLQKPK